MENDAERTVSRSTSATSTLDPYYFGGQSESDEPVPPLPPPQAYLSPTPEFQRTQNEPTTPARNPAMIDRRGLVGVGELATPRWTKHEKQHDEFDLSTIDAEAEGYDIVLPDTLDEEAPDMPDSPWTIEAIDGETSEKEEVRYIIRVRYSEHTLRHLQGSGNAAFSSSPTSLQSIYC